MYFRGWQSAKSVENALRYKIKRILIPTSSKQQSSSPIEKPFPMI